MNIRTFICIEVPQPVLDQCGSLQKKLKPLGRGVRWARTDGIHLTLKFLGNVPEAKLSSVANATSDAVREIPRFSYKLKDCGAFPNFSRPRVYWIGVHEPTDTLLKLQKKLENTLEEIGFEMENRKFSPHITLGRVKTADGLREISAVLQREPFETGWIEAREVTVMKSDLMPSGSVYTPLFIFKFES
ncbi:RNA 2',3'-cyclic phosphodiesterase [candidate division KSB1 bacterium]|nr:RNA 2',3'-cyclic phosphodiesterase [candidate division KSB1 bacterium]